MEDATWSVEEANTGVVVASETLGNTGKAPPSAAEAMHVELQMDIALLQRAMKAETEAALMSAALDAETARWEEALRLTWRMVDPLKPAGTPGSYARGQDSGIVAALTTLRANLRKVQTG